MQDVFNAVAVRLQNAWFQAREEERGQGLVEYALIIAIVLARRDRRADVPEGQHCRPLQQGREQHQRRLGRLSRRRGLSGCATPRRLRSPVRLSSASTSLRLSTSGRRCRLGFAMIWTHRNRCVSGQTIFLTGRRDSMSSSFRSLVDRLRRPGRRLAGESGQGLVEYALIIAIVSLERSRA